MLIIIATHVLRSTNKIETKRKERKINVIYLRGRISSEWCVSAYVARASCLSPASDQWICALCLSLQSQTG
jgi:hypothetical protein